MFKSPLHRAILAHVQSKIEEADEKYLTVLEGHNQTYQRAVEREAQVLKQNQELALQEAIKSVVTSLN